ncbi:MULTISPECIES: TetR/AcrR family transcriptional regulator [unclassified Nocardioides]|uniref:TetR/AcrR family transcriptional regulator n=1 Tax=unclassified Nocardioides TaxID=2615069 RepID=UPI0006F74F20|nr:MULTISPECIES: TetR/AcrR family transcriptional regulator [unclassified Nocardioides]KRA28008.1 hypothetical protein ASD81_22815 [Nocardioides sp. Root614]KRA85983.1 hypothetical protein ASD84_23055 [Nocardioides sp. Root682]
MAEAIATRQRRKQTERTAATRTALLDATIASLVETGYASVTTAEIAQRAGVTRGAQAHHFGNKAELVTAAVRHLASRLVTDFAREHREALSGSRAIERMLDQMWDLHRSELFAAAIELWNAARTDPELRVPLKGLEADVMEAIGRTATLLHPWVSEGHDATKLLSTTMSTMRGLAMLTFVQDDVTREWRAARQHLLELWLSRSADS